MRYLGISLNAGFFAVLAAATLQTWPDLWWHIQPPTPAAILTHRLQPFVQAHCYQCHDSYLSKGDFAIDRLVHPVSLKRDRDAWERVLQHVSYDIMPPPDADQPAPPARAEFVRWLDRALHPIDPRRPDPGHVVIRRLNREEYKNTVQDLFGIDFDPTAEFPEDDIGHGFDHIGETLSLSPLLMERYLIAAEQIAAAVIPDPLPPPRIYPASADQWENSEIGVSGLSRQSELIWKGHAPVEGLYHLDLRVYQDQAGSEPAQFSVLMGRSKFERLDADGSRHAPRDHGLHVELSGGPFEMRIAFLNDFYQKKSETSPKQDRNLYVESASLEGPYLKPGQARPTGPRPDWVVPQDAQEPREAWLGRMFEPIMKRAFRGPFPIDTRNKVVALVAQALDQGDSLEASLQLGLRALLASPAFLFRGESQSETSGERIVAVSPHALATRLSYFLWSGPPDERLFELADSGKLASELTTETERMLADPRIQRFIHNFAGQWLHVRNLPMRSPDSSLYPEWNAELAQSMKEETLRFFGDFLLNNRPMIELLTADYSYVDGRLAQLYGLTEPPSRESYRVPRPAAGIFNHAGILTVSSYPNRTSPVLRGKFVLENILGTPPPPPPPNVPSLADQSGAAHPTTLREQLELHRDQLSCRSCHAMIDPIGFAFEHYDAIGRFRDSEAGRPIDSEGQLTTGEIVRSPEELATALARGRPDAFYRNFAETLLTYALGRGLDYFDRPAIDRILEVAAAKQYTLPAFIEAVISSVPFRFQRGANFSTET